MFESERIVQKGKLDAILRFLLREEDSAERTLNEIEKVLEPFWDKIEVMYPAVSRNDDKFFMLVTGFISDIEDAAYKAGFLDGFSIAWEIEENMKK